MSRWFVILACAALLAGCSVGPRLEAAGDVHALLVSVRDDDQAAFDARVDRRALEGQMRAALEARAARSDVPPSLRDLGIALAGPLARSAGEFLLQPRALRTVAAYYGYQPERPIPNQLVIAGALKLLPDGRVCAQRRKDARCLLTFAKEGDTWRLVGFDAEGAVARVLRGPPA